MIRTFRDGASFRACAIGMLLGAAGLSLIGAAVEPTAARSDEPTALKIGLLMDFSGGSTEVLRDRRRAFELAIEHVNEGGGVFGLPVTIAVGDTTADPEKAVAAARHLVEVTATFRRKDGRTLHVRKATRAEPEQQKIFRALGTDPAPGGIRKMIV